MKHGIGGRAIGLIDADKLRTILIDEEYPCALQTALIGIIDAQPTAYDVDKVVEQLEKKILPKYFNAVIHDKKKFEICKDEDDLQIGDAVILKEWNGEKYTGREVGRNIVYILRDAPEYGLMPGYVIFGW